MRKMGLIIPILAVFLTSALLLICHKKEAEKNNPPNTPSTPLGPAKGTGKG